MPIEEPGKPAGVREHPTSLWRNRTYLLLWGGQIISSIGTQVSDIAFPLLVLVLTKSPAQAGFVGAAGMLPYFIFSLPAGVLIDRWNRRWVMLLCDTGRALALGSIPLAFITGHLTLLQLYLVSLTEGTLFVFFNIAEVASLPSVVSKEHLPTVATLTEFTNSMSSLIGPSLAGILYSLGQLWPFLADTVSYVISVLSLSFLRIPPQTKRVGTSRNMWGDIWEGLHWLWQQPLLTFLAVLGCAVHLFGSGMILIVIVSAQQQHVSTFLIGLILAGGGVGTLIGAFLGGFLQKRVRFAWLVSGTQWISALLFPLYVLVPNAILLTGVIGLISGVITVYGVVQFSYRLVLIPNEFQGRANSVFRLVVFGGDPLGLALTGLLLQVIGIERTVAVYTVCFILLALATTLNRHVRATPPLVDLKSV